MGITDKRFRMLKKKYADQNILEPVQPLAKVINMVKRSKEVFDPKPLFSMGEINIHPKYNEKMFREFTLLGQGGLNFRPLKNK